MEERNNNNGLPKVDPRRVKKSNEGLPPHWMKQPFTDKELIAAFALYMRYNYGDLGITQDDINDFMLCRDEYLKKGL